jgi:hypothetical protein
MTKQFNELNTKLDAKADKVQVERLINSIDGLAQNLTTEEAERAAIVRQLDRQHAWIRGAAKQLDIGYDDV